MRPPRSSRAARRPLPRSSSPSLSQRLPRHDGSWPPWPQRRPARVSELDQSAGEHEVSGSEDARRQQARVARVADRDGRDRHPAGICTIDSSESSPSRCFERHRHADHRQRRDRRPACPGRCAAPPAPAMITRSPRSCGGARRTRACRPASGGPRPRPTSYGDAELRERLGGRLHHRPVGVRAHHDADQRLRRHSVFSPSGGRRRAGALAHVVEFIAEGGDVSDLAPGLHLLAVQLDPAPPVAGAARAAGRGRSATAPPRTLTITASGSRRAGSPSGRSSDRPQVVLELRRVARRRCCSDRSCAAASPAR